MSLDTEMNNKLDILLSKMDSLEKKIDSVESKMDERLNRVENVCHSLNLKQLKLEKKHIKVANEVTNLKIQVHALQQEKIKNNVIVRGINEVEKNSVDLNNMLHDLFQKFESFNSVQLIHVRRIGTKKANIPRAVLAEFKTSDVKLDIMQSLKDKNFNCSQFMYENQPWGSKDNQIFLSDHLTTYNNNIFFHARRLKRAGHLKYAWSKLGKVYIKKDDESRAHNVESVEQLQSLIKETSMPDDSSLDSEADTEADTAAETDCDTEKRGKSRNKRKMNSSNPDQPSEAPKKMKTRNATNKQQ